ncbi:conserved exported protein of unknown function [Denitratisoma oestradiolicum]|uniref:Cytochrome c n=2 Tax=Denitratisoma oestradiolicum TaxID=311182 RepID=A0A6S6XTH9_9PROT|nr:conserved exported protein of unknown function [Denitratisoma oestradiolicum]
MFIRILMALPIAAVIALPSWAAPSPFEEPIRYRRAAMVMIKVHYDRLSQMAKGTRPTTRDELQRNALYLEQLSRVSLDGFVPGSHEGDTKASANIWKEWQNFKSLGEKFQGAALRLRDASQSGDVGAAKGVLQDVTRACKACHDEYKLNAPTG